MTTEAELLQAVAADLDDLGAWQVFVDWLLEREDPRAELFRLQTAIEDADEEREAKALSRQVSALLDEHGERWLAGVRARKLPVRWGMERGVVGRVSGKPKQLASHAAEILAAAPLLVALQIDVDGMPADRDLSRLAGSPLLARARSIAIQGAHARVAGWQHLEAPALRSLVLSMVALGRDDVEVLVARGLPRLERLKIMWSRLNKAALEPLARLAAPITNLDLAAAHVGRSLGAIVAGFAGLRVLRIPGNELGSDGLAAMLPALADVTHLDLRGNELRASDVGLLLAAIPKVRVLKLGDNALGVDGVEQVAAWPGAARLTWLDIGHHDDRGALALARSTRLSPKLERLMLGAQRVSPEVEHALLDAPRLAGARIHVGMKMLGRKKREAELAKAAKLANRAATTRKATTSRTAKGARAAVSKRRPASARRAR